MPRRLAAHSPDPSLQPALFAMTELHLPTPPRRLFTALFPPPEACAAIDAERQRWSGLPRNLHPVQERMHITLQCFNQVDARHERAWRDALAALRFEPFDIALTEVNLWQTPNDTIAVLLPERSEALAALHCATAPLARQAGLPASTTGWRPHLTTLRGARQAEPQVLAQPIRWTIRQVDLIWSELKARPPRYHRLARFPD